MKRILIPGFCLLIAAAVLPAAVTASQQASGQTSITIVTGVTAKVAVKSVVFRAEDSATPQQPLYRPDKDKLVVSDLVFRPDRDKTFIRDLVLRSVGPKDIVLTAASAAAPCDRSVETTASAVLPTVGATEATK